MSLPSDEFFALSEDEQWDIRLADELRDIKEYLRTGEIRSGLSLHASLAICHAESNWRGIVPKVAEFEQRWIKAYALVIADLQEISYAAKEFELRHWMGFCEEDVAELIASYREWCFFDWNNATKEEGDAMRNLWSPSPTSVEDSDKDEYWRKRWQKYIDRRVRKPLQEIYNESPGFLSSGGSALQQLAQAADPAASLVAKHLKVNMGGSAGRVLLTIIDKIPRGDPDNKFDGAHVTLIFDETAGWPCGAVQGQAATRDEAVGMLKAVSESMPSLIPDSSLRIC